MITLDIAIVTHNGGEMLERCLASLSATTVPHRTRLWMNGICEGPTQKIVNEFWVSTVGIDREECVIYGSSENAGFLAPNNRIEETTPQDRFLCLLNDDTEVREGWELPLLGALIGDPTIAAVGYSGGILDPETCQGAMSGVVGDLVDYVEGWCLMLSPQGRQKARETSPSGTLFDETNQSFAYGEDSDLCLRLREAGMGVVALPQGPQHGLPQFVEHKRGQTTGRVLQDGGETARRLKEAFDANHKYLRERWGPWLAEHGAMAHLRKQGYTL